MRRLPRRRVPDTSKKHSDPKEECKIEPDNIIMDNATITMEEYKKWMCDDTGQGLVQPEIPATTNFELKGHILYALKHIPFYRKDNADANKHIDEVNNIVDYFHVSNVPRETVLLRVLLITFKGEAKEWIKSLPHRVITTWEKLQEEFIQ